MNRKSCKPDMIKMMRPHAPAMYIFIVLVFHATTDGLSMVAILWHPIKNLVTWYYY